MKKLTKVVGVVGMITYLVLGLPNCIYSGMGYFTKSFDAVLCVQAADGQWIKENNGLWWYKHSDGGYTTSNWEKIGGK